MEEIWNNCLSLLSRELDSPGKISLVRSLKPVVEGEGQLSIIAPNDWAFKQIDESLGKTIRDCLNRVGGQEIAVTLKTPEPSPASSAEAGEYRPLRRFKPEFTFENFISGERNSFAFEVCRQICRPSTHYQQLLVFGGVGLGKTHLLHAVGNELGGSSGKVAYFHAEQFIARAVASMRERRAETFSSEVLAAECLLLDDLQFVVGKKATELVLLNIIDSFLLANKKLIVVCDRYPKSIKGLDPRLQSRLCSFLSTVIEPPDCDNRIRILKHKATQLNLDLDEGSYQYIAECISNNVRELEGALKRVSSLVHFCGKSPNIETVREALRDIISSVSRAITIAHIADCITDHFGIAVADIVSASRLKRVALARHICVYFCKELTRESAAEIGRFLGGRDHTTVRHSYKMIHEKINADPVLADQIKELRNLIVN